MIWENFVWTPILISWKKSQQRSGLLFWEGTSQFGPISQHFSNDIVGIRLVNIFVCDGMGFGSIARLWGWNLLLFWLLFAVHPEVGDVFFLLIPNHEALVLQFDFYCHDLWYVMIPISLEQSPIPHFPHLEGKTITGMQLHRASSLVACSKTCRRGLRFGNGGTWGTWGTGTRCKRWLESSEPQRCDWLAQTRLLASLPFLLFAWTTDCLWTVYHFVCFCKRTSRKVWRYGLYGICWIHKQFCHIRRFGVAFVCRIAESWRFDSRIWSDWSQESDGFLSAAFKRCSSRETARWCAPCDHWRRSRTPDEAVKEEEGTRRRASHDIFVTAKTRKSCERMWNTVSRNNESLKVCLLKLFSQGFLMLFDCVFFSVVLKVSLRDTKGDAYARKADEGQVILTEEINSSISDQEFINCWSTYQMVAVFCCLIAFAHVAVMAFWKVETSQFFTHQSKSV